MSAMVEFRNVSYRIGAKQILTSLNLTVEAGETLVSRTITDLAAGSGITFIDRGEHELKGLEGMWPLYLALAV